MRGWHTAGMYPTYIVICQLESPVLIRVVQKVEDTACSTVSPQLRPGVRESGIVRR